ncbi:MAG: hypothetical protein IPL65_15240 [Lewinellaceae bacterium]|nr:hypothetical protein [Lewinellaceae bacterium]
MVEILGIRHHGPGSANMLRRRLEEWAPDLVLIEGPPDADDLLPEVTTPGLLPPLAMLVYNPKQLQQAVFYPFAAFSPEWQAMQYAAENACVFRFMDLPMAISFAQQPDDVMVKSVPTDPDPFAQIAALGGYSDPERWWEAMFERQGGRSSHTAPEEVFAIILELMRALRSSKQVPESEATLLREAYMRQMIRQAQKDGFKKIAIVCGAWHAPALEGLEARKNTEDATLLKGLKKVKTQACWIPWSFDRLAFSSGYGAGVIAPAWYQMLWEGRGTDAPQSLWMTRAARYLREQGMETSAAHVIEAIRLADTMAALRETLQPGIAELREAAIAVLAQGNNEVLALIDREMVIGDVLGEVPDQLNLAPLKVDFEAQAKSCRLQRSNAASTLKLDLREPAQLRKSHLLHRLQLLGIAWGNVLPAPEGKHGTFHEHWELKWQPEFEIRLLEAGIWGNTVADAAAQKTLHIMQEATQLRELSTLLSDVLRAELTGVLPALIARLQSTGAMVSDALLLAEAIPPLTAVWRYGSVRKLPLEGIWHLLDQIIPRVCIQLPDACVLINEDLAEQVHDNMRALNRAFGILDKPEIDTRWCECLQKIRAAEGAAPLLAGFSTRLLFDKNAISWEDTAAYLQFELSSGQPTAHAAQWLEGFLYGSGLLLLHQPTVWQLLYLWVGQLEDQQFVEALPILRRSFSRFSGPEREKMLLLAKTPQQERSGTTTTQPDQDNPNRAPMMALIRLLLHG